MEDISLLAGHLNFAFNSGNMGGASELAGMLYNEVGPRRQGGKALIGLDASDCQCVGFAFAITALNFDFGDEDINSVAAENAYYCLARSFVETNNTFCMPAIFTLLYNQPGLLRQKFISSWCAMAQKEVGMPIGMMLGGNPFIAPHLSDFREQAIGFMDDVMYYTLTKFYDIAQDKFLVPTDLHLMLPKKEHINAFIAKAKKKGFTNSSDFLNNCKEHFVSVYEECEDTLKKF